MRFSWTLQRYIFGEMIKTFVLTAVGLTGVFLLGGGVLNMVKVGDVTPGQLLRMLAILLPLAAALTLPVSALFSAASAYGRISADNEFTACRSSGINIHVLLLPAFVLSLVSASLTFILFNFVIPGMVQNLNTFLSADVGKMIEERLSRPKGLSLRNGTIRLCADQYSAVTERGNNQVTLGSVVFVEVDGERWVRYGSVDRVQFRHEQRDDSVGLSGRLFGVHFFDRRAGDFSEMAELDIPQNDIALPGVTQLKFLDLFSLLKYQRRPYEWTEVRKEVEHLRAESARLAIYDGLWARWQKNGRLELAAGTTAYTVTAESAGRQERDGMIELKGATIAVLHPNGRGEEITAKRANVDVKTSDRELDDPAKGVSLRLALYDVTQSDGERRLSKSQASIDSLAIDQAALRPLLDASAAQLLESAATASDTTDLARRRMAVLSRVEMSLRTIASVLHERASFSVSICALVILAAALAIIFRGSHVLTAFGISFIPLILVIVAIMAGKQLSRGVDRELTGLLVMWGGIGLVVLVDAVTLLKVLRR